MVNILVGCTGSVATIKIDQLVKEIRDAIENAEVRVVMTESAKHFYSAEDLSTDVQVYVDNDEWAAWTKRGDPVLHIELGKWADLFLIAPLDANTLAKMANGLCDNLLTCTARAWNPQKSLVFCPAMNTRMYNHPLTEGQISVLKSWGYLEVPAIEKTLMCGDTGIGAMAEVPSIVAFLKHVVLNNHF